jgi:hypothetical protein
VHHPAKRGDHIPAGHPRQGDRAPIHCAQEDPEGTVEAAGEGAEIVMAHLFAFLGIYIPLYSIYHIT